MQTVYIALGSNLENPLEQLKQAVEKLKKFANEFEISPFYGSKPVGPQDQPDYVNAVAKFSTDLSPTALLDKLQSIENEQGRVRVRRWGERTLDLDIILYGNQQIQTERLNVPHIEMKNREFVIVPMFDLTPDLVLPTGEKLADIYAQFKDHQMIIFS
ncbi:TPA: 2-amino-4-hydroxy-6-hydroxymethyldihydropteridine diphosphokinase [Mannheimia haemolytica]|uniref:2-amino-4-hydroxy-6-hydroxymethyldihydropteridine pyrophosphokinase n=1 Tax=Mannheimia haemolytica TaxID=75985 RepID=A0A547ET67_MANHA|nr:2-amino-4-hydroxy-6-hydroxymethyldihydropteridine diphosphokinase [Mannheimia haemolytica]AWW70889.1 2-amino-4-hydroxy-6-hydroxymethyldihydropteridine diphosphokinase [Pasteurellaceae bacterium 12565]AGI31982.1 2-amino-4-hydroxy-6-hydroxymethyldihydropteridine diphosphokinase [Mannheimia haemolytica USDA-ARS-USMARC-183]AGI35908.1 2-amino-4-hydroxy-6-hydroxymethyldihydropteridine diphosphokinase [Mannheimia haemolytica USDA-ARS-USMARC-185]AGK03187.1 6-hydroxymethyl-7,8-dihydropterin pyrophosp